MTFSRFWQFLLLIFFYSILQSMAWKIVALLMYLINFWSFISEFLYEFDMW